MNCSHVAWYIQVCPTYAKSLSMKPTFRIDSWTVSRKMPAYRCPNATTSMAETTEWKGTPSDVWDVQTMTEKLQRERQLSEWTTQIFRLTLDIADYRAKKVRISHRLKGSTIIFEHNLLIHDLKKSIFWRRIIYYVCNRKIQFSTNFLFYFFFIFLLLIKENRYDKIGMIKILNKTGWYRKSEKNWTSDC